MIEVRLVRRRGRKYWQAEWRDPLTGRTRSRSTGEIKKKLADKFVANLERDLLAGTASLSTITWDDFRRRHRDEVLPAFAEKTRHKYDAIFGHVEEVIRPKRLSAVDAAAISRLQSVLRSGRTRKTADGKVETVGPLAEITIRTSLIYLRAALRWAHGMGMIATVPKVSLPKRVATAKGRAPSPDEFERILAAVPAVVGDERAESWRYLLRGLWWGGLRLGEAIDLHWTSDARMRLDLAVRRPMFVLRPSADKTHRDRLFPVAPEFAALVRHDERSGFVFNPRPRRGDARMRLDTTSKVVTAIGKAAGVRVSADGKRKTKWASAHDLRRAFGFRWAMRIAPAVLKTLMRHEDIATTMQYYVGHDADAVADVVWQSVDTLADTRRKSAIDDAANPQIAL